MKKGSKKKPGINRLTVKQRKYVRAVVNGTKKNYAVQEAGYVPGTPSSAIESQAVKNAIVEAFRRRGLTEDRIALSFEQGLQANQFHYFTKDGIVTDERITPDAATRHKYAQTWLEVNKYIKTNGVENINIGLVQLPSRNNVDNWNDVSSLDGKIDSPTVNERQDKPT